MGMFKAHSWRIVAPVNIWALNSGHTSVVGSELAAVVDTLPAPVAGTQAGDTCEVY